MIQRRSDETQEEAEARGKRNGTITYRCGHTFARPDGWGEKDKPVHVVVEWDCLLSHSSKD